MAIYSQPILLDQPGVDWFEINGSTFRNYHNEDDRLGYYEVLVDGTDFTLVSKRLKLKEINSSTYTTEFFLRDSYYLFLGDKTFSGQRKGAFFKAFPDLKKEINAYVRTNRLRIGVKYEDNIIQLAQYCNQLISIE